MQRIPMFIKPVIVPEPTFTIIPGVKTIKQQHGSVKRGHKGRKFNQIKSK